MPARCGGAAPGMALAQSNSAMTGSSMSGVVRKTANMANTMLKATVERSKITGGSEVVSACTKKRGMKLPAMKDMPPHFALPQSASSGDWMRGIGVAGTAAIGAPK